MRRAITVVVLEAAACGLFYALWRASGREPRYTQGRYRGTRTNAPVPPQPEYYALEGHECTWAEWEQVGGR